MIIGNLSKFAIWINGSVGNLSYIKFYVNGHSIGTFDDGTYTSMFINNFIQRLDTLHNLDFKLPNKKYAFNYIHKSDDRFVKYKLPIGDSFDDYYIYIYNNSTRITWKIVDEPFFCYHIDETKKIFDFKIDKDEVKRCLYKLKDIYEKNK